MKKMISFGVLAGVMAIGTCAMADMSEIKAYKEAFSGAKVKCVDCHTAVIPKKGVDTKLNAYGTVVAKKAGEGKKATAETYTAVGTVEAFAKAK